MSSLALAHDVDVGALLLQLVGQKLGRRGVRVDPRITGGELERTIDGASTLTLYLDDSDRGLLRSGLFDRQIDLRFDELWWRLVQVSKIGDELTLTFEDRAVALLRQITTPRKAARSKMTRAEFALSIVREVKAGGGIPFVCPELHVKQKVAIESSAGKTTPAQRKAKVGQGLAAGAKLTVQGTPASSEQRGNAERVLDVASSLGAGERATLALMQAVIVESWVKNLGYGDATSTGILQLLSSTARGMGIDARDVEQCCNAFLTRGFTGAGGAIALAAKNPSWTTGQVAQGVQGSGHPSRYDKWRAEAERWLAAYGGGGLGGGLDTTATRKLPYQFQRGGADGTVEDSWACLQRLAQEVGWRCYAEGGAIYFVSETTLGKAKPRAMLSEDVLGVSSIDFDVDNGKADSEATVTARAARLAFPPGSVVVLDDCGPADGRWLVQTISRGVFDAQATIRLKRPTEPLPEPAAETTTVSIGGGDTQLAGAGAGFGAADGAAAPEVERAYQAAQAMDAKVYPYVWGGGHARAGYPDHGQSGHADSAGAIAVADVGFDCSGSTCAILAAAGMGYELGGGVDSSGPIAARWGQAGEGRYMTVWANAVHVWIEFKPGGQPRHFGTGEWGISNPRKGPRFQANMHTKAGFTPRHWPGT